MSDFCRPEWYHTLNASLLHSMQGIQENSCEGSKSVMVLREERSKIYAAD